MADVYNDFHGNLASGALAQARKSGGNLKIFPFSYTFVTGIGAAPTLRNMAKVPAGTIIYGMHVETDGLSISAGVALTIKIGDADDDDRFALAFDADVAGSTDTIRVLGHGHEYTVDSEIKGLVAASKTPVVGKSIWGYFLGSSG